MKGLKYMVAVICLLLLGAARVNGQVTIQEEHVLSSSSWANGSGYSLSNVTCYRLESDITIENTFTLLSGTAVFNLNGHKLILKESGYPLFDVRAGAHLYIWDVEVADDKTIVGGAVKGTGQLVGKHSTRSAIEVKGTLTFESGTITGFERSITLNPPDLSESFGPAIFISSAGTVNMTGGTITDCGFDIDKHYSNNTLAQKFIKQYGGAVYVQAGGTFNFSGGTISNCNAFRGGGVFLAGGTTASDVEEGKGLIMSGSAKIHNCLATHRGGGVYVDAAAFPIIGGRNRFVLSGNAVVDGCKASSTGCGVFSKGIVSMTGGYMTNNVPITGISNNSPVIWQGVPNYSLSEIMASNAALGGGICIEGRDIDYDSNDDGKYDYSDEAKNIGTASFTMSGGEISGNIGGSGGGIMAYDNSSLQVEGSASITGNHAIGNGGTGNGGGIYVQSSSITFGGGTISGNYARRYGGGINVNAYGGEGAIVNLQGTAQIRGNFAGHGGGISQEVGVCNMTIGGNVMISENTARGIAASGDFNTGGNGGGVFIVQGSLTVSSGHISGNIAGGNGGGVTLESGSISMTMGNITNNSAANGGGICLKNGTITVSGNESFIQKNSAETYGGGLYVVNEEDGGQKAVTFTGGTFVGNKALYGGGICVHGNINLTATGTTLTNNTATNGGGAYLFNDGKGTTSMAYAGGLITGNTASGMPDTQTTAYDNDSNNKGVGGGVYLAQNTSLSFSTLDIAQGKPLGLYGNSASFAADDIYANGIGTKLVLPNVSKMQLQGFNVPTSELYWVEDYVRGDTEYAQGTVIGDILHSNEIFRYKEALSNLSQIHKIQFNELNSITYDDKYICLALGYDLYYVTLIKKGLQVGESAVFNISYKKDGVWYPYRTISFPCVNDSQKGDGGVRTIVLLPAGTWKFEENAKWSWKYNETPSAVDSNGNGVNMTEGVTIDAESLGEGETFMYTFTNTSNNSTVKSDEAVIVNKLIVQ